MIVNNCSILLIGVQNDIFKTLEYCEFEKYFDGYNSSDIINFNKIYSILDKEYSLTQLIFKKQHSELINKWKRIKLLDYI